jgi:hypothetical protein
MRQLLMTMLMIITVVYLYMRITQGEEGMREHITTSGSGMADHISRMSP